MVAEIKNGTVEIPCPYRGELSPEPIEQLVNNDVIPCSLCGGLMDLSADNCRPLVAQAKAHSANAR